MIKLLYNYIPFSFALWFLLILNSVVLVFHTLILMSVIPYDIVWAGKLKNTNEMIVFESISISINTILLFVLLLRGQFLNINKSERAVIIVLWFFVIVFSLNTAGNLFSKTSLETFIATPLTFISAILCLRLTIKNK